MVNSITGRERCSTERSSVSPFCVHYTFSLLLRYNFNIHPPGAGCWMLAWDELGRGSIRLLKTYQFESLMMYWGYYLDVQWAESATPQCTTLQDKNNRNTLESKLQLRWCVSPPPTVSTGLLDCLQTKFKWLLAWTRALLYWWGCPVAAPRQDECSAVAETSLNCSGHWSHPDQWRCYNSGGATIVYIVRRYRSLRLFCLSC